MKNNFITLISLLTFGLLIVSCGDKEDEVELQKKEALQHYTELVKANYDDAYASALTMKQAIDAFVANPTDAGFQACKTAWLNARNPYGQTEAFRFYAGPIDDANGLEGFMNAWPMDENFIDYVQGDPSSGLINASQPNITKQVLFDLNEIISEESIFTGWHAIEFLLWGQDLSATGPGNRPFTDYVQGGGGTAANQDRRGQYLLAATELLLDHLDSVRNEWKSTAAYPQSFLNDKTSGEAMGLIFFGLKEFSITELSGERMFVAIDVPDQEHEHSCFADNTNADIKMNLQGIKNVYFGTYQDTQGKTLTGKSFSDVVVLIDKSKDDAVRAAFADTEAKINAIPAPFDQAILNNVPEIQAAIASLEVLGNRLAEAGKAIGAEF